MYVKAQPSGEVPQALLSPGCVHLMAPSHQNFISYQNSSSLDCLGTPWDRRTKLVNTFSSLLRKTCSVHDPTFVKNFNLSKRKFITW